MVSPVRPSAILGENRVFAGKTFLITGGTGSFGNAVVRHLLTTQCREIRILSRDEAKQDAMRHALADERLSFRIGDVRDDRSVRNAMRGVDFVFHAAALKQVPACEFFPEQAIMTNVMGSQNVLEAAIDCGVERVVAISTDKAVYPINAMGMSKAVMEKLVRAKARAVGQSGTILACVRYGNVLYSRGSVVPVFIDQIKRGGPVTLTVPYMTRFLLTLADAIHLIEFALLNAAQGDIFIRKSPAATVEQVARALMELYDAPVEMREIGIRHGEKIHETLGTFGELSAAQDMGQYFRIAMDSGSMNYDSYLNTGDRLQLDNRDYSSDITDQLSMDQLKALLLSVPEVAADLDAYMKLRRG